MPLPTRTQLIGWVLAAGGDDRLDPVPVVMTGASDRPRLIAVVGRHRDSGKSALAVGQSPGALAGEVVSCDSTAVYRGFDIGTDKPPRRGCADGVPHHLIDVADPVECYSAARYVREASAAIRAITARGTNARCWPGGTGFYYRAVTRGLFDGPGPERGAAPSGSSELPNGWGDAWLHRMVARLDPPSGQRIQLTRPEAARSEPSRCIS